MIPKFRFWYEREDFYPDENYMRDVWKIEHITDSKIELNDNYIFNPYTNAAENIYAKTKVYLMQSTGLKDKNGVEIFEGDVLILKYPRDRRYTVTAKVIRGTQISAMVLKFEDGFTTEEIPLYKISAKHNLEVIGNIYENPELLEVAE